MSSTDPERFINELVRSQTAELARKATTMVEKVSAKAQGEQFFTVPRTGGDIAITYNRNTSHTQIQARPIPLIGTGKNIYTGYSDVPYPFEFPLKGLGLIPGHQVILDFHTDKPTQSQVSKADAGILHTIFYFNNNGVLAKVVNLPFHVIRSGDCEVIEFKPNAYKTLSVPVSIDDVGLVGRIVNPLAKAIDDAEAKGLLTV